eukprot:m.308484 g.308484  ORF g.308484 m.308484 type:complete len:174 (-) comp16369_c0_seq32:4504-5025(-)
MRVAWEVKKPKSFGASSPQQLGEAACAARLAEHPILTVCSDQTTNSRVMWWEVTKTGTPLLKETTGKAGLALQMLITFLKVADPDIGYTLPDIEPQDSSWWSKLVRGTQALRALAPLFVSAMFDRELELLDFSDNPYKDMVNTMRRHLPWRFPKDRRAASPGQSSASTLIVDN